MGWFGWTAAFEAPPQLRWEARVDLGVALPAVRDVLQRWWTVLQWPSAPPFSGGVLDAWPARIADGLVICRQEWAAVQAVLTQEAKEAQATKEANRG